VPKGLRATQTLLYFYFYDGIATTAPPFQGASPPSLSAPKSLHRRRCHRPQRSLSARRNHDDDDDDADDDEEDDVVVDLLESNLLPPPERCEG